MDKTKTLKKLNEIAKVLTSDKAISAIEILKLELASLKNSKISKDDNFSSILTQMPLPLEIKNHSSRMALYTDGACRGNPGPGSWAYIIQDHTGEIVGQDAKHEKHSTNNKMELTAIISGLEHLYKLQAENKRSLEIWVYTDSKYAVDGMKSWVTGWKKRGWRKADNKAPENLDLWQKLDSLNGSMNIVFNWVKGHAGHAQNEYVDQLANRALDENGF